MYFPKFFDNIRLVSGADCGQLPTHHNIFHVCFASCVEPLPPLEGLALVLAALVCSESVSFLFCLASSVEPVLPFLEDYLCFCLVVSRRRPCL